MRQYKITAADFAPVDENDCYLAPDDPIHEIRRTSFGELGSEAALANYINSQRPVIFGSDKGKLAREQNIQPGTQEWFAHWFGRNN